MLSLSILRWRKRFVICYVSKFFKKKKLHKLHTRFMKMRRKSVQFITLPLKTIFFRSFDLHSISFWSSKIFQNLFFISKLPKIYQVFFPKFKIEKYLLEQFQVVEDEKLKCNLWLFIIFQFLPKKTPIKEIQSPLWGV